jgi:hypothetical protein
MYGVHARTRQFHSFCIAIYRCSFICSLQLISQFQPSCTACTLRTPANAYRSAIFCFLHLFDTGRNWVRLQPPPASTLHALGVASRLGVASMLLLVTYAVDFSVQGTAGSAFLQSCTACTQPTQCNAFAHVSYSAPFALLTRRNWIRIPAIVYGVHADHTNFLAMS